MGLQQTLDQMKQDFVASAEPEVLAVMRKATDDLLQSGILDSTLKPGDKIPEFTLEDADGKVFYSRNFLTTGPLLITFYRGIW
ncbi:MAG TPA: hypothetical protein VJ974_09170 [Geopsychrobacteraceae bacterium]|nr:hypothetical protein [Geopsychrobacteraceae bacterium]